jgi:hypothetical protein
MRNRQADFSEPKDATDNGIHIIAESDNIDARAEHCTDP